MKVRLVLLAVLAMVFSVPSMALSSVMGTGEVSFNFSSGFGDNAPKPYFYGWSENYYGQIGYYDPAGPSYYSYPWAPNGQVFLDSTTYMDTRTDGSSNVHGEWNPNTGAGKGSYKAVDNHSDQRQTNLAINIGNPYRFLGPFSTLPDFSYDYAFSATKTELADSFSYAVQIELGYIYLDDAGRFQEQRMYSDYGDYGYGFRDNWVYSYSDSNQALMSLLESGSKTFSGFTTLDSEPHLWFIEYGFGMGANAVNPVSNAVVPEPASFALLGIGLAGVFLIKKRKG